MRRALAFVLLLGLLVAAAWWLAAQEGAVEIAAGPWRIETPLGIAAIALVLAVGVIWAAFGALRSAFALPARFRSWRARRRQRRGEAALVEGLVAVASGETRLALSASSKANVLLGPAPLPVLLSGMAARLAGDGPAAEAAWRTLAARPDAGFLGLRGLVVQALEGGDLPGALNLAREAHAARPAARWPAELRFDLAVRAGAWSEALDLVRDAERRGRIAVPEARRRRAVLSHAAALAASDGAEALRLARRAAEADPAFAPASAALAERHLAQGRAGKAAAVIEAAWAHAPHPALAQQFLALYPDESPLARAQRAEGLARRNPTHRQSHMMAAEAALAASLWGEARRHLEAAIASGARERRLFLMLAELEEREFPGEKGQDAARAWLKRAAAESEPDARWHCAACGHGAESWSALCPACGAFDSLRWGTASAVGMPRPALAVAPRPPALPGL
ncbi:MAG: heme biosynthesis protein HemY [Alphaproteobacteria bacterium]|nr:heme biosynthesis protein HemY [Alphaproteobacteria bacterium]